MEICSAPQEKNPIQAQRRQDRRLLQRLRQLMMNLKDLKQNTAGNVSKVDMICIWRCQTEESSASMMNLRKEQEDSQLTKSGTALKVAEQLKETEMDN